MGCGAAKSVNANSDTITDEVENISSSITQIRDIAPPEVADTGAHPPRKDDLIRRNVLHCKAATILSLPGVVPENLPDANFIRQISPARRGESIIKMHPPKKPQRLGDSEIIRIKTVEESEELVQEF